MSTASCQPNGTRARAVIEASRAAEAIDWAQALRSSRVIGEFSLTEQVVLAAGESAPWITRPWVRWSAARARTVQLLDEYRVQAPNADTMMRDLSGGNQQRMIIAAAMERRPALLVAENPTRGLDLRATSEVLDRLRLAARSGVAVLVHLPDLDELLEAADRIVVVIGGKLIAAPGGASRDVIGRMMLGEDS